MGTLYQLLALPACFLLLGFLRGGCGHHLASLLRRLAVLTGARDAARVELMKRFSPGVACGFVDSIQRRDSVVAPEKDRRKGAAPGPAWESRSSGTRDVLIAGSGTGAKGRPPASRRVAPLPSGIPGYAFHGRRFALRSAAGSP